MYTKAFWESVNSIKDLCTYRNHPNHKLYCVTLMYTDVQRWMFITSTKEKSARDFALAPFVAATLLLAR
jgi:hypothetical protein